MIDPDDDLDGFLKEERLKSAIVSLVSAGLEIVDQAASLPPECPFCSSTDQVVKRRLNTKYVEDDSNWLVSCHSCYLDTVEYYNELWAEYRASQGF